jgi:hypothetical protein
MPSTPPWLPQRRCTTYSGEAAQPGAGRGVLQAPGAGGVDHRDPLVAGTDELRGGLAAGRDVVDPHVRVVVQRPAGHHHGDAHQVQPPPLVVADRQRDQDERVHLPAGGQLLEEAPPFPLLLDLVEHHIEIGAAQAAHDAVEHRRVEPVRDVGGHHRDAAAGAAGQPGGVRRHGVREVLGEALDPAPGLLRHAGRAAQGPGHRRDGDAGALGEVGHVQHHARTVVHVSVCVDARTLASGI